MLTYLIRMPVALQVKNVTAKCDELFTNIITVFLLYLNYIHKFDVLHPPLLTLTF